MIELLLPIGIFILVSINFVLQFIDIRKRSKKNSKEK